MDIFVQPFCPSSDGSAQQAHTLTWSINTSTLDMWSTFPVSHNQGFKWAEVRYSESSTPGVPHVLALLQHHCRNCGDIFCNECSDQKMQLPSSAKPVRVCDGCNVLLLARATKTWTKLNFFYSSFCLCQSFLQTRVQSSTSLYRLLFNIPQA